MGKTSGSVLLALTVFLVASCDSGGSTSPDLQPENEVQQPSDTLGTIEGDPVSEGGTGADGSPQGGSGLPSGRIGLVVDSTQRCAKIFEPIQVSVTRQLAEGEQPTESGELPSVTGLVNFDQSYGTSLNLVSHTDASGNFEMGAQDIVGLTSSIENGSVTVFLAGYAPDSPQRFIMRKPVPNGCMYAFKSDDYCSTGFSKTGKIAFSRNGVSMTATGCELNNPDNLPVLEIPSTGG